MTLHPNNDQSNTDSTAKAGSEEPDSLDKILFGLINYTAKVRGNEVPSPNIPLLDLHAAKAAIDRLIAQSSAQAELRGRIEEIEDIDQSRAIEVDDNDYIWCTSCHMVLEDKNQDCACNIIYQNRRKRLAQLRAQENIN